MFVIKSTNVFSCPCLLRKDRKVWRIRAYYFYFNQKNYFKHHSNVTYSILPHEDPKKWGLRPSFGPLSDAWETQLHGPSWLRVFNERCWFFPHVLGGCIVMSLLVRLWTSRHSAVVRDSPQIQICGQQVLLKSAAPQKTVLTTESQVCGDPHAHQRLAFPQEFRSNRGVSVLNYVVILASDVSLQPPSAAQRWGVASWLEGLQAAVRCRWLPFNITACDSEIRLF